MHFPTNASPALNWTIGDANARDQKDAYPLNQTQGWHRLPQAIEIRAGTSANATQALRASSQAL
jgi:hypothetical protein